MFKINGEWKSLQYTRQFIINVIAISVFYMYRYTFDSEELKNYGSR